MTPSLPTSCNSYSCDGHVTTTSPERLEELLTAHWTSYFPAIVFCALFDVRGNLGSIISRLITETTGFNLYSPSNAASSEVFRREYRANSRLATCTDKPTVASTFFNVMAINFYRMTASTRSLAEGKCMRGWSEQGLAATLRNTDCATLLKLYIGQMNPNFKQKPVTFQKSFTSEINEITMKSIPSSKLELWLRHSQGIFSTSRILQFGKLGDEIDKVAAFHPLPYYIPTLVLTTVSNWWNEGSVSNATKKKQFGDDYANKGDLNSGIWFYDVAFSQSGFEEKVMKVQTLTNAAALRLRLAITNKGQLPHVALNCTMALEIDPNNKRISLGLSNRWNEAIVDFERALELDPNSPAKKELEVARRQVTRRIGS